LATTAGALTTAFRFLATDGFNNDHFVHLSAAQQMLFGDWPSRDFIDIGRPLTIASSALAQSLVGHTLFAEAVLVSIAFGLAAALTVATVFALTDSRLIAVGAAALEVAAFPLTYAYPKVLATAICVWLLCRFVLKPSMPRQLMMAGGVALAFLFRHDLGLFLGAGGFVASLFVTGTPKLSRHESGLVFAAMVLAMIAPYLVYVELNGGLWNHFVTALDANGQEAGYAWPNPFSAGASADSKLLYVFHLLPVLAFGILAADWKRYRGRWSTVFVVSVSVVAVAENFGLMRDSLEVRVPDAIVPAVVLGAWLVHSACAHRWYTALPAGIAVLIVGFWIASLGNVRENLGRAGLNGDIWVRPWAVPALFAERSADLQERLGRSSPSRQAWTLRPFFAYLDRCTTQRHRLFLGGMLPEVAYLSQRAFAGGGYEHYNFRSPENQRRVVERLRQQLVPFALIPSASAPDLDLNLPIVSEYLRGRYRVLADLHVVEDERIEILIDSSLPSSSRDAETGWPCFR
jgi:hypothetical protein